MPRASSITREPYWTRRYISALFDLKQRASPGMRVPTSWRLHPEGREPGVMDAICEILLGYSGPITSRAQGCRSRPLEEQLLSSCPRGWVQELSPSCTDSPIVRFRELAPTTILRFHVHNTSLHTPRNSDAKASRCPVDMRFTLPRNCLEDYHIPPQAWHNDTNITTPC